MKQIKAKVVPYSSVVGSSVMLLDEKGRCIGQVAFLCHSDELRGREVQGWLAETISLAINGAKP